jgi:hypothetical protein
VLQLPLWVAAALAEDQFGIAGDELRFDAMAPASAHRARLWAKTVALGCGELVDSDVAELHPLVTRELTRLVAAAMLETFANTAIPEL